MYHVHTLFPSASAALLTLVLNVGHGCTRETSLSGHNYEYVGDMKGIRNSYHESFWRPGGVGSM
jgi:hypothetical protein